MRKRIRQRRRLTRHLAFRPAREDLESRIALSGAQIGINLDSNYEGSNNPIWTNVLNEAAPWQPMASGTTLPLTADGYPLANAWSYISMPNFPDGNYQFSYTGTATLGISSIGQIVGPVTTSNGVTSGTIVVDHTQGDGVYLNLQLTNVSPTNPMDNFHIMMPGYGNGTAPGPMFMPAFIASLQPFSNIRFMNWTATNGSTLANWQDRVQPNAFLTDGPGGVPYEDMIELCNEAQKDMWINIPALATPNFVQDLAQLISSKLDSNLNVYVEYGNEDWNGFFSAYSQIFAAAQLNPLLNQSLGQGQLVAQQTAYTLVNDGRIFDQAFGSAGASRVRPMLGGQASYDQFQTWELQFIQQQFGTPSQYIYSLAVAPYIFIDNNQNVAGLSLDQLFADLNQYFTTNVIPWIDTNAALANQYGVPMTAYEGGQSLIPGSNGLNEAVMQQAQNDPRMYQLYVQFMQAWQQAGGGVFDAYQLTGFGNQYGFWGILPNVTVTGSQRYDALLASAYPAGDANTDGSVDFADFQVLQANYGTNNTHWVQGDFNDDGWVNWSDLNILRQDLNPSGFTLSQFAQQAIFGQPATVHGSTALEYDGYGVTYAGSQSLAPTTGTVQVNQTSAGQSIVLSGVPYTQGLGFGGNASTTIALNGQYARFDSLIGVDSSNTAASAVIFQVYGDYQLLYQSPVLSNGSTAVPIDVNVAGVKGLTLVVEAAPGSSAFSDHAVWADARLVSTANFGAAQPYTMTWQVSQNGQVIGTQTADSFVLPALSGTYTLSVTVSNGSGNQASASTTVTVVSQGATAKLLSKDPNTSGNWIGYYGSQGYDIAGETPNLPLYASVNLSGAATWAWGATTDPRGLLTPSDWGRYASAWYNPSSFTINVNLTDGQIHELALYAVDWDSEGRTEQIQVINAANGSVLDTENLSSFSGGVYLKWTVNGSIQIKVTNTGANNAVVSGLFLDPNGPPPATATLVNDDTTTKGNWIGAYGSQGYDIEGQTPSIPSYANVRVLGASTYDWGATTDPRGLLVPGGSGRDATTWYSPSSFTINVNFTDGQTHDLALYAVDWDSAGRSEQIQVIDVATGIVLDNETLSSLSGGVYLQWAINGNVQIKVTRLGGTNAVVSGLFFDPSGESSTSPTFLKKDTATEGNWIGVYGSQGDVIEGQTPSIPSYATVGVSGASTYDWGPTYDPRGLLVPGGSGRDASTWYSPSSFTINVSITDGQTHDLALYAVDWDSAGRNEQIQIINAANGSVLDTENLSSFSGGAYLQWAVSGNIQIKVTNTGGRNAVVSGLFFDPSGNPPTNTASLVKKDTTTIGNWIGAYGSRGYDIEGETPSLPSDASVSISGASTYAWGATYDPRGLLVPGGSSRYATTWYSSSGFTIDVNFTDTQTHYVSLYAVDWESAGRSEQIQVIGASTGAVLDTETLSSMTGGVYLQWAISGSVQIKVTKTGGNNAVVSGLFFD